MFDWFKKSSTNKRSVAMGNAEQSPIVTGNSNTILQGIPPEILLEVQKKLLETESERMKYETILQSLLVIIGKSDTPREKWGAEIMQMAVRYCNVFNIVEALESSARYKQDEHLIHLTLQTKQYLFACDYAKVENSLLATSRYVTPKKVNLYYHTAAIETNNALVSLNYLLINRIAASGYSYQAAVLCSELKGYEETSMRYLREAAVHFEERGQYREAILLFARLVEIAKKIFPSESTKLAVYFNDLAALYYYQGRVDDALPLYQRSLAIKEKILEENHSSIATGLNNLAGLYESQGRYEEALPLYQRSLAIDEKVYGKDHPDVATDLNNLAGLYRNQGRYDDALPLYQRSLAILEKSLGTEHPTTKIVAGNYAQVLREMSESGFSGF